jgi:hypothetical protein
VGRDLRVADSGFDSVDAELVAEISRCLKERQLREFRPEVELVAGRCTAKASEDVALNVDRERGLSSLTRRVAWQRAEAAPLIATDDEWLVVDTL